MVVNMGLFATQSSKQTIQTGLSEASSPLVVDGDIMIHGSTATTPYQVDAIMIPLQVIGVRYVPMDINSTEVTLTVSNKAAIANCYLGVSSTVDPENATLATMATDVNATVSTVAAGQTACQLFIGNSNNNTSLDSNEKGYLVICVNPTSYQAIHGDTIYIQIRPEQGAPLAVSFVVSQQLSPGWQTVGT
jgi:flagellin FlaB